MAKPKLVNAFVAVAFASLLLGWVFFVISLANVLLYRADICLNYWIPVGAVLVFFGACAKLIFTKRNPSNVIASVLIISSAVVSFGALPFFEGLVEFSGGVLCRTHMDRVRDAIGRYAALHGGQLPPVQSWASVLLEEDSGQSPLTRDDFRCPYAPRDECSYCLNMSIAQMKFDEMPVDAVLLFESRGGWDCAGGTAVMEASRNGDYHWMNVDGRYRRAKRGSALDIKWK